MALIREDKYGLYIKSGGYIARPVPTEDTRHMFRISEDSEFVTGDKVQARHIGGTGQHKICHFGGNLGYEEWWSSHGAYIVSDWENDTVRTLNSEECWEPAV